MVQSKTTKTFDTNSGRASRPAIVAKGNMTLTFMAPLVAMALRDKPVINVQAQQIDTSTKLCQMPAIPTILQNCFNSQIVSKNQGKDLEPRQQYTDVISYVNLKGICKTCRSTQSIMPQQAKLLAQHHKVPRTMDLYLFWLAVR